MEDETFTNGCYIKKYEDNIISQNNISEDPIQKIRLSTIVHNSGEANANLETKQIEDHFRLIKQPRSCSYSHIASITDYVGNDTRR